MTSGNHSSRTVRDSMGPMHVPESALYGATTARAMENFPISNLRFSRSFLRALGLVKAAAAIVNQDLGELDAGIAERIERAALEVADGVWDDEFVIDLFQTGSGTSTNMNANEVIAALAARYDATAPAPHPNDDVNHSQSSNDVIPTAIHVAAYLQTTEALLPALEHLKNTFDQRAAEFHDVVKTGRTHLMDATPVRLSDEIGGWAAQIANAQERIATTLPRLAKLAIGGTAVGTGINAPEGFGARVAAWLRDRTGAPFVETDNHFEAQASMDTIVELSGQLKATATAYMKIANDLRWMNSGPQVGLSEIVLPALQPGSSIMPGKINPVIPEATMMVAAQVIGNDTTVTVGGQHGNFELNVMLPVVAHNVLESVELLTNISTVLADKAVAGFTVNAEHIAELVDKNPILVTALNPVIGYEAGAKIAKQAYAEGRRVKDVAVEQTDLTPEQLDDLLDPAKLADPPKADM